MLLSLLPVNILMCVWLFSFKCCGEENAAAAYGASDFQVAGFHRTRSPKKKPGYSGKSGKTLSYQDPAWSQPSTPCSSSLFLGVMRALLSRALKGRQQPLVLAHSPTVGSIPAPWGAGWIRADDGLQIPGEALHAFPDLVAGFVQPVLGCVVVDPDVSWEWPQWERPLWFHCWGWKPVRATEHPSASLHSGNLSERCFVYVANGKKSRGNHGMPGPGSW